MIIRQHWRNSMLHSASCLELVLLVTLRWYVIPSALGNHHTNQTRRNDRHNRHRRGPAAPTPPRPPRTLTQPEVGAQPIRSKRQARVGEALRMPGTGPPRRRLAGPAPVHSRLSSHTLVIANVLVHGGRYYFGLRPWGCSTPSSRPRGHRCNRADASAFYERLAPPTFSDAACTATKCSPGFRSPETP